VVVESKRIELSKLAQTLDENKTYYNESSIGFIFFKAIVQPDELLVLADNRKICLGKLLQRGL